MFGWTGWRIFGRAAFIGGQRGRGEASLTTAMNEKRKTLDDIRKETTEFQQNLLQEIWQHFKTTNEWPNLRAIYSRHDKRKVRDALTKLGRTAGWEVTGPQGRGRYQLSLLGSLLSLEGSALQALLTRLFEFQRKLYQEDPEKIIATSAEIREALQLGAEETALLGRLLLLAGLGGSQNLQNDTWTVTSMEEAADFPSKGDLSAQVAEWVCRFQQPAGAVFIDQSRPQYIDLGESSFAQVHSQPSPPEITVSLERLRGKYPDPKKLGFLIMRFTESKPFQRIVDAIKKTATEYGLVLIRADDEQFHADLWGNVRTLLHGCGFGIAVYERIDKDEPNANVGLEVGYLMAMNKPVMPLKDKTVQALHSDLTGKLYKPFDPHDPEGTIPTQLSKWLADNGITIPKHSDIEYLLA
jgi:hypothetical protein